MRVGDLVKVVGERDIDVEPRFGHLQHCALGTSGEGVTDCFSAKLR